MIICDKNLTQMILTKGDWFGYNKNILESTS